MTFLKWYSIIILVLNLFTYVKTYLKFNLNKHVIIAILVYLPIITYIALT